MSAAVNSTVTHTVTKTGSDGALAPGQPRTVAKNQNYKGFVGGVFSGIAKLSGELRRLLCPNTSPS